MRRRRWLVIAIAFGALAPVPGHAAAPPVASPALIPALRLSVVPAEVLPSELSEGTVGIGPGSLLAITIGGSGTFGCTANFVWSDGTNQYLGTAGHCVVPASKDASAGPGVLFDPSIVHGSVCAAQCGSPSAQFVALGPLVYGRRRLGPNEIGHDFGLFRIAAASAGLVRPAMPIWGGPTVEAQTPLSGQTCMYGNGAFFNQHNETRARTGVLLGTSLYAWNAAMTLASGDSGSGVVTCATDLAGVHGVGGLGIATHIAGADTGMGAVGPRSYGTLVAQAEAMAAEAGLNIHLVTA